MTHAVRIHTNGGPEVMQWEAVPTPEPGPGEALIRHGAVGLNYIDVYFRTGLYKAPNMPLVIGQEGAGTVLAVGPDVKTVAVGDRVWAEIQAALARHERFTLNYRIITADGTERWVSEQGCGVFGDDGQLKPAAAKAAI